MSTIFKFFIISICFIGTDLNQLHSQSIETADMSDIYVQHMVVTKGGKFLCIKNNMRISNEIGAFENDIKSGDYPSFRLSYDETNFSRRIFWSLHPITILPYTEYVVRFLARTERLKGNGPSVELAIFDETRDTERESYKYTIQSRNNTGWSEHEFRIQTKNKARFVRLMINAEAGGSCKMWISEVFLEQASDPMALQSDPVNVLTISNLDMTRGGVKNTGEITKLPPDRNYFAMMLDLEWKKFQGTAGFTVSWLGSENVENILSQDHCVITDMKGIQPQWNGIGVRWWKNDQKFKEKVSWKSDKLFNSGADVGSGEIIYRTDQPEGAKFVRVVMDPPAEGKGSLVLKEFDLSGEF